MQTSATGLPEVGGAQAASDRVASDRAKRSRGGFTLVELLMVVAILGLAAGAVVLAAPDPRPSVGAEAERFAARLVRAREEAVLTNRTVAVETTAGGYEFSAFDGVRWTPLAEGPFGPEVWGEGTAVVTRQGEGRAAFDSTGGAEPAAWSLTREGRGVVVLVDGAGEVRVDG